jgi:hypothetical protein
MISMTIAPKHIVMEPVVIAALLARAASVLIVMMALRQNALT